MKKNTFPLFRFQQVQEASKALAKQLRASLTSTNQKLLAPLVAEMAEVTFDEDGKAPVTMAFVGQYNAGKSTLLKCLTENKAIAIDADVCTNEVTAYDWGGLRVIDTPGIHAGFPIHDDLTEQQVSRSHLLVFVITGELFGDDMAKYFRDLAFMKNYASKLMLVVNKMDQDPGSAENKRDDIERITTPLRMEDFRTVFVSGEIYLDALAEIDPTERQSLIAESGMPALMAELDAFAKDCGLLGALTAPLFSIRSLAAQAAAICSADRPEERAVIELLGRRGRVLRESRSRLSSHVEGLLNAALAGLGYIGDSAAGEIVPSKDEETIKAAIKNAESSARERVEKLKADITDAISRERETLKNELNRLAEGDLAVMLRNETDVPTRFETETEFKGVFTGKNISSVAEKLRKTGEIARGVGNFMIHSSIGSKGISGWSSVAAAGSDAHKLIYSVGKLFGYSFKPWEAVGYASKIAKFGKILGPIAAGLQVAAQFAEEKREDAEAAKFKKARTDTRALFLDGAGAIQQQFIAQFEAFLNDFYGSMQSETDRLMTEMNDTRLQRNSEAATFGRIAEEATILIGEAEVV